MKPVELWLTTRPAPMPVNAIAIIPTIGHCDGAGTK
jgi:hypothetical protein